MHGRGGRVQTRSILTQRKAGSTSRARALAGSCSSFVCGRSHEPRYKSHEARANVAPTVVGTSKGGCQPFKRRGYVQLTRSARTVNMEWTNDVTL